MIPALNPAWIGLIVFAGCTIAILGIGLFFLSIFSSERAAVEQRFRRMTSRMDMPGYQEQALTFLKRETDWRQYSIFSEFPPLLNLPELFIQAGIQMDVGRWLILVFSVSGIVACVAWLMNPTILAVLVSFSLSILSAYAYVLLTRKKRLSAFEAGLAQSLEVLGRSLRAGHPLTMGLQMVSAEMPDPIRTEFGRVFYEQQMGLPFDDSLRRMAQRVPILDLRFFVLSVLIHQQTGGDLAEVLDNLSRVIRDRFKVLGQVKALTAEGRLSGWVLSILPIGVFLIINFVNPAYLQTLTGSELGRKMLYIAGFLQVVGMLAIQKIVRIKV